MACVSQSERASSRERDRSCYRPEPKSVLNDRLATYIRSPMKEDAFVVLKLGWKDAVSLSVTCASKFVLNRALFIHGLGSSIGLPRLAVTKYTLLPITSSTQTIPNKNVMHCHH
jgi:hypothetical protein